MRRRGQQQSADTTLTTACSALCRSLRWPAFVVSRQVGVVATSPSTTPLGITKGTPYAELPASIRDLIEAADDATEAVTREILLPDPSGPSTASFEMHAVAPRPGCVLVIGDDRRESERLHSVRRDFFANVSHEIKTPVAAIGLLAEALTEAADDPDAVREFARSLQEESARLTRLSRDVIELSRIEGGMLHVEDEPFPISGPIADAVEENALAASAKHIDLRVDVLDDLDVSGDRRMITTALSNLIENAIQYSKSHTAVTIRAVRAGSMVAITVTDRGIGIHPENLDRVFERFYREDPSRAKEGSGLGLSIVKHTANVHQGSVHVTSRLGLGSAFTIELPCAPASEAGVPGEPESEGEQ